MHSWVACGEMLHSPWPLGLSTSWVLGGGSAHTIRNLDRSSRLRLFLDRLSLQQSGYWIPGGKTDPDLGHHKGEFFSPPGPAPAHTHSHLPAHPCSCPHMPAHHTSLSSGFSPVKTGELASGLDRVMRAEPATMPLAGVHVLRVITRRV